MAKTLFEFDYELRCQLTAFRQFWAARNSEDSVTWPGSMTARQWFEEFAVWVSTEPTKV